MVRLVPISCLQLVKNKIMDYFRQFLDSAERAGKNIPVKRLLGRRGRIVYYTVTKCTNFCLGTVDGLKYWDKNNSGAELLILILNLFYDSFQSCLLYPATSKYSKIRVQL